jgi:hypothetical protein
MKTLSCLIALLLAASIVISAGCACFCSRTPGVGTYEIGPGAPPPAGK